MPIIRFEEAFEPKTDEDFDKAKALGFALFTAVKKMEQSRAHRIGFMVQGFDAKNVKFHTVEISAGAGEEGVKFNEEFRIQDF